MKAALTALLLAVPAPGAAVALDESRWAQLNRVAASLFDLPAISDDARFGRREYWQVADAAGGDCEDKALLARAQLVASGWPPAALRLALAWTEAREYHAVLTVDVTRAGVPSTFVIDNRFPWALAWDALSRYGYRWDMRQRAGGAGWVYVAR